MNTQQLYDQYAEARAESEHPVHSPTRRAELAARADALEVKWMAAELVIKLRHSVLAELAHMQARLADQNDAAIRDDMWLELQAEQEAFRRQW